MFICSYSLAYRIHFIDIECSFGEVAEDEDDDDCGEKGGHGGVPPVGGRARGEAAHHNNKIHIWSVLYIENSGLKL